MLVLQEIQKRLLDRNLRLVATATGLHYNTVLDIAKNPEANPSLKTLTTICEYLERNV